MSKARDRVVYRYPNGTWANRLVDDEIPTTVHDTQQMAIDAAKQILKNQGGGRITVIGRNGQVTAKLTIPPAKEPCVPEHRPL